MNFEQIAHCILTSSELKESDLFELEQLTRKYPYASTLHYLYIQGVSKFQASRLDDALEAIAYQLSDRKKLYEIMHSSAFDSKLSETKTVSDHIEAKNHKEDTEYTQIVDQIHEPQLFKEEIIQGSNIIIEDATNELNEHPALEFDSSNASSNYLDTKDAKISEVLLHFQKKKEEIPEDKINRTEQSHEPTIGTTSNTEITTNGDSDKKSFTAWLRLNKFETEPKKEEEIKLSRLTTEEVASKIEVKHNSEEKPFVERIKKEKNEQLIDQFITGELKRVKPKDALKINENQLVVKESLNSNSIPVSETLAKIYAKQGNFPKAIHVYHQLSLAFPEKKSFFALQIQDLKKKMTE
jgi:hypothetical protein